jgi:hypothetical protein
MGFNDCSKVTYCLSQVAGQVVDLPEENFPGLEIADLPEENFPGLEIAGLPEENFPGLEIADLPEEKSGLG